MRAVKIRRAIGLAQIQRVVAVVKQAQSALFIGGVRVGVREAQADTVAHTFFYVRLQRVISGNAGGFVAFGFRRIADVRNAQVDVATFVVGQIISRRRAGTRIGRKRDGAETGIDDGIAVTVNLPMNRMGRRSNLRLVKRNGNNQVSAEIPDVADLHEEIVARLPLYVQRVVDAVGQFIFAIVNCEREKLRAVLYGGRGWKKVDDVRRISRRRRLQAAAPRRR